MATSADLLNDFQTKGYCIVDKSIPDQDFLVELRNAADKAIHMGKEGSWPEVRRAKDNSVWGINNICKPSMPNSELFLKYLSMDTILGTCATLLECPTEQLQFELGNLLCMPDADYSLSWHRDYVDIRALHGSEEVAELERQLAAHQGVQWNTALYEDSCFVFIPASNRRAKTEEEQTLVTESESDDVHLPGEVVLTLQPGQTVFYDSNLLHRGVYKADRPRATLHFCVGYKPEGHHRVYIVAKSNGLDWTKSEEFKNMLPKNLKVPVDNLWENHAKAVAVLGADAVKAQVEQHNARSDVSEYGLVGNDGCADDDVKRD